MHWSNYIDSLRGLLSLALVLLALAYRVRSLVLALALRICPWLSLEMMTATRLFCWDWFLWLTLLSELSRAATYELLRVHWRLQLQARGLPTVKTAWQIVLVLALRVKSLWGLLTFLLPTQSDSKWHCSLQSDAPGYHQCPTRPNNTLSTASVYCHCSESPYYQYRRHPRVALYRGQEPDYNLHSLNRLNHRYLRHC